MHPYWYIHSSLNLYHLTEDDQQNLWVIKKNAKHLEYILILSILTWSLHSFRLGI